MRACAASSASKRALDQDFVTSGSSLRKPLQEPLEASHAFAQIRDVAMQVPQKPGQRDTNKQN